MLLKVKMLNMFFQLFQIFFSLEQQTKNEIKTGACERERGERVCVAGEGGQTRK